MRRFKAAYWSQDTRDSYVFHSAGAMTRDLAMQQAIRVAVGDLVHHGGVPDITLPSQAK